MYTLPDLPDTIAREVFANLCASLPAPAVDTPDSRAARDEAAMAAVAALHPADAWEAKLAADLVSAEAYLMDCRRLASEYRNDIAVTLRCRAQANSAMRELRSLLRDYRRTQAERDKALNEMHPAAMERSGWWFRDASIPAPTASPEPVEPPQPTEPTVVASPAPDWSTLTEAEQFALIHPDRARGIRAAGGLPAGFDYGPPEPHIVAEIVNGTSPILRALDRPPAAMAAE
ncbi:MAG TPA: hypothetical protein VKI44_40080 [Acetobacteraceae bacterium]|nr:hypothetical protein [Acetobacteraceae bacterium]